MIERFKPAIPLLNGVDRMMLESTDGEFVKLQTILNWLKEQRNDIPVTGEELANGLAYECGTGENYFK